MVISSYVAVAAVENIIVTMEEDLAAIHHQQMLDILVGVTPLMVLDILLMPLLSIEMEWQELVVVVVEFLQTTLVDLKRIQLVLVVLEDQELS